MAENAAPEQVWVQLTHGKPVLYDCDPREVHDSGKPVYAYVRTQPDARRDEALQKLDVMFRTWFPARLQEEARSLVNGLITRANPAAPDAAQDDLWSDLELVVECIDIPLPQKDSIVAAIRLTQVKFADAVRQARRETWEAAIKILENLPVVINRQAVKKSSDSNGWYSAINEGVKAFRATLHTEGKIK